jgi:hypothetical protein
MTGIHEQCRAMPIGMKTASEASTVEELEANLLHIPEAAKAEQVPD